MQNNIVKSAMKSGLILGVLFSINFLLSVPANTVTGILTYLVIAAIVSVTYRLAVQFRDRECGGYISYGKVFLFILLSFFYAALISSLVKFVYFQFINPGYLEELYNQSMLLLEKMGLATDSAVEESLSTMLKPAAFSLQYIWINMMAGCFVGLVTAAFVKKEKSIFED